MHTRLSHAILVVLALSSSVMAQTTLNPTKPFDPTLQQITAPNPETYGTAAEVVIAVPDSEFNPSGSITTFAWTSSGKFMTSSFGDLEAGVHLPAGASITRVELQACNTNATATGHLFLVAFSNFRCFQRPRISHASPNGGLRVVPCNVDALPHGEQCAQLVLSCVG
jgi:hypothetical protein